jgi:hypothetical protein
LKAAVTFLAALMLTVQAPVPVQSPLQPAKVEPAAGVAVRVTLVPLLKEALHVLPQSMFDGLLVRLPYPVPEVATVKV